MCQEKLQKVMDFLHLAQAQFPGEKPSRGNCGDMTFGMQADQRLAHRRVADPQLVRQFDDGQMLARTEPVEERPGLQGAVDLMPPVTAETS